MRFDICKNIYAGLFSIHNTISLSCHEQVYLSGLRFERYFSHHRTFGRSISRNVAHLKILVPTFHATCLFLCPLETFILLMVSGGTKKDRGMKWVNQAN